MLPVLIPRAISPINGLLTCKPDFAHRRKVFVRSKPQNKDANAGQGDKAHSDKAMKNKRLSASGFNRLLKAEMPLFGESAVFASIFETVEAVAARNCPVVISGETGVGKEMVARQIHLSSSRSDGAFIPVDCTGLTGELFESQLFGHVRGAFTGAIDDTLGFFRAADGGTIFLDGISEIPIELQGKLLRVLQESAVTPLGSTELYPINVRVLCATCRNLHEMVEQGGFRADLYYRLNVVHLEIPLLRQRKEDIMPLAEYFLANLAVFYGEQPKFLSRDAKKLLLHYSWPGNIRELSNALERACVVTPGREIPPNALPPEVIVVDDRLYPQRELPPLDEMQRRIIIRTLEFTEGRKIAAAKILGIERRSLNHLIEKLNIPLSQIKKNARS